MSFAFVKTVFANHPILRGMVSYTFIWPTGNLIQQTMEGRNWKTYNYRQCLNYALFGTFYVAPTLYGWVRISSMMWPTMNLRNGVTKALVEQLSYGPFAGASFFFCMSLLEGKRFDEATKEVRMKFLETYKVGLCVWPVVQTINYALIPEHNRVPFVSVCSVLWTIFLSYVKQKQVNSAQES